MQVQSVGQGQGHAALGGQIGDHGGVDMGGDDGLGEFEGFKEQETHPYIAKVDFRIDGIERDADGGIPGFRNRTGQFGKAALLDLGFILDGLKAQRRAFGFQHPAARESIVLRQTRSGKGAGQQQYEKAGNSAKGHAGSL